MLNQYTKAFNSIKVNAISGTLIKSHPKSFFQVLHSTSGLADLLFSDEAKMFIGEYNDNIRRRESVKVVILQTMLTGFEKYDVMVEVVRLDDYLEEED